MNDPLKKILEPIKELQNIRGIDLPIGMEFLQLVVTGPPGAGKSYYIEKIGGWPNEGYLDLTEKGWWRNQSLVVRPREVHLGLPFKGLPKASSVFDKEWLDCPTPPPPEFERIVLPPEKKHFWQTDWRNRYIFEFLLPAPTLIYERRLARQSEGYFPVDENLNLEMVRQQVNAYREAALYLHRAGLNVYIRKTLDKPPLFIAEKGVASVPRWTLERNKPAKRIDWRSLILGKFFNSYSRSRWITLEQHPKKLLEQGRIAHDGRSFEMIIGDTRLRFQPEILLGGGKKETDKAWRIGSQQGCSSKTITGFIRVRVGETVIIGKSHKEFREVFHFSENLADKHLTITNRRGDLIVTPLVTDPPIEIARQDDLDQRERLEFGRYRTLLKISSYYGQRLGPLSSETALTTLRQVNILLHREAYRPVNRHGNPGGLLELPSELAPIFVGDLHAQVDNLLKILSDNCLFDCLREENAVLIILGDAVHAEAHHELSKFDTSMLIMDLILRLKLAFPTQIFYLRGNHDSFSSEYSKGGVLQGLLWREYLQRERSDAYVEAMEEFYSLLPYMAISDTYIACHAGPPLDEVNREIVVNIADHPHLAEELVTTRIKRPNSLTGYGKRHVKRLRTGLGLTQKARLIVGHTPMDPFNSFWLHAGNIKNHHVIYSAHNDGPSSIIRVGENFLPISYPAEPLTRIIDNLK